jgi:hypothetical protein
MEKSFQESRQILSYRQRPACQFATVRFIHAIDTELVAGSALQAMRNCDHILLVFWPATAFPE